MSSLADECTISFEAIPNGEYPGLTTISASVSHPVHGDVANLSATRVDRFSLRGQVHEALDEESAELGELVTTLMDNDGVFRPWLLQPGWRAGSGVWSKELNKGSLVYVDRLNVKTENQGRGIGTWSLSQFLEKQLTPNDFAIYWPVPQVDATKDKAGWITARDKLVKFIHKIGFRRIGRTGFFAYSPDPAHPSRLLPSDQDVEPAAEWTPPEDSDEDDDDIVVKYPLHGLIACSTLLPLEQAETILSERLKAAHAENPASLSAPGLDGELPLHIAAKGGSIVATRLLLELLGDKASADLENRSNRDGMTPLEAVQTQMLSDREFSTMVLSGFPGGMPADVKAKEQERRRSFLLVEKMLKQAMGEQVVEDDQQWLEKRQHGCTCGECFGGWLSWRMRFRLYMGARSTGEIMGDQIDSSSSDRAELEFIPKTRRQTTKSFLRGYAAMFLVLGDSFYHPRVNGWDDGPSSAEIDPLKSLDAHLAAAWQRTGRNDPHEGVHWSDFVHKCGGLEDAKWYALDCLTRETQDGDTPDVIWEETPVDVWESLPNCANDFDFELVRKQLGFLVDREWGPFADGNEDCDDDEDGEMTSDD